MENRFRRLPPRIEPRYETQDVSPPPPLPQVRETVSFTPAGQVAGFERLADAAASATGRRPVPRRLPLLFTLAVVLVALLLAIAVGVLGHLS
jgi:hypothetical protein